MGPTLTNFDFPIPIQNFDLLAFSTFHRFLLIRYNDESRARRSLLFYHNCSADLLDQSMTALKRDSLQNARHQSIGLCQLAKQPGATRKGTL